MKIPFLNSIMKRNKNKEQNNILSLEVIVKEPIKINEDSLLHEEIKALFEFQGFSYENNSYKKNIPLKNKEFAQMQPTTAPIKKLRSDHYFLTLYIKNNKYCFDFNNIHYDTPNGKVVEDSLEKIYIQKETEKQFLLFGPESRTDIEIPWGLLRTDIKRSLYHF